MLVVEDDADTRQVLKFMLEIEGAQVEAVESGADAVARAETFRPQIVLCDIGLPDIDGLEVARRMRGRSWFGDTRLIALTGYGQPDDIRHAIDAGFEAHLTKPINLDQLLALLGAHEPFRQAGDPPRKVNVDTALPLSGPREARKERR